MKSRPSLGGERSSTQVDGLLHASRFPGDRAPRLSARLDVAVDSVDVPRGRCGLRLDRGRDEGRKRPREGG